MKRLTDKELAAISHAASYLTKIQKENREAIGIAYYLWKIYKRHMTDERFKNVLKIEKSLIL